MEVLVLSNIFIISVIFIIYLFYIQYNKVSRYPNLTIPFKESIDLVNLPIVTFVNNNIKLHFLLDTGSDDSFIIPNILSKLSINKRTSSNHPIVTGGGVVSGSELINIDISYKNNIFNNTFIVSDLGEAFDNAVGAKGIVLHGILGSIFFTKYKYILNFDKLEFSTKNLINEN